MKITILTGLGETEFSSNICLARALRQMGHEVWIVGPNYSNTYGEQAAQAKEADVILPDSQFPHYYSYEKILSVSPWTPDVIFAIDPRGALNGEKPKGITSCFYSTDFHRAGLLYKQLIAEGSYDIVFVGQGAYLPFFEDSAPIVEVVWPAVEASRFPDDIQDEPVCDIIFVGHSGIASGDKQVKGQRYDGGPPSYDYAERAELLLRLSDDFDVQIHNSVWKTPDFCRTLQRGRVGFNHSILHDCSIRNFEVMAAGRPLVTDDILLPGIIGSFDEVLGNMHYSWHVFVLYSSLYRPFYPNFDVEYAFVKKQMQWLLDYEGARTQMGIRARTHALKFHTWGQRAGQITRTLETLRMGFNES